MFGRKLGEIRENLEARESSIESFKNIFNTDLNLSKYHFRCRIFGVENTLLNLRTVH